MEEYTNDDGAQFAQSMTMAEMAHFEVLTGGKSFEDATQAETLIGMTVIAAQRIGFELTATDAENMSLEKIQTLMGKAAAQPPAHSSENLDKLLNFLAGK